MYEDIDTQLLSSQRHLLSTTLYTTLYFQSNPRWLSHPSCSPRHSTAYITISITSTLGMGDYFRQIPVPASASQDPSRLPGQERWITPVPAFASQTKQPTGSRTLDSHPVPAFASPRSSTYGSRTLDLHPVSASATPSPRPKPPGSRTLNSHPVPASATPGQIKPPGGQNAGFTPCQHLRLRSRSKYRPEVKERWIHTPLLLWYLRCELKPLQNYLWVDGSWHSK
jgi:hypothetical protein